MASAELRHFVKNSKKVIATTTNYLPMLKILNIEKPTVPILFMKPTSSYIEEGQAIKLPHGFTVNQEIELGVVIGKRCKAVKESNAMEMVGGYCAALDMTATCQMVGLVLISALPLLFHFG
uniref:oxaloacetate tautomerase n=1 Tax=Photinus pyralis TaxID=7054 RepID=A0A1Y1KY85_PHOPY